MKRVHQHSLLLRATVIVLVALSGLYIARSVGETRAADDNGETVAWQGLAVGELPADASSLLLQLPAALQHTDPEVRQHAAVVAARLSMRGVELGSDPSVADGLLSIAESSDPIGAKASALTALGLGVPPNSSIEDRLLALYENEREARLRAKIIAVLAERYAQSEKAVRLFHRALNEKQPSIVVAGAYALARSATPVDSALPRLLELLQSEDEAVASAALVAMREHPNPSPELVAAVQDAFEETSSDIVSAHAKNTLMRWDALKRP